jgi:hypothetical protein
LDIKNLVTSLGNCEVNVGRGGSQKSHALSPLDFRLSMYIMIIFKFKYKSISYLNTFNDKTKDKIYPIRINLIRINLINLYIFLN